MRLAATFIGIICSAAATLLVSACSLEPSTRLYDAKGELNKLKGPEVTGVEASLKSQAEASENAGDYKLATQNYKQLADQYPEKSEYKIALADNMRRINDNDGALRIIDGVLKKDHDNASALEVKGLCLLNEGEFTDAGKVFGEVMKADPKRWRTLNGIGILFTMKNMTTDALAYYQAALDQSTDNPSVLNNLGLTLAMDKQYDKAEEALQRAGRHLQENSAEAKHVDLDLALVYAIADRLDDAERTAAPHLSKAQLYNNMGFYSYLAKNNELAKSYLNMALTQSPVYYDRAWRNLSALNGEPVEETTNTDEPKPEQKGHIRDPESVPQETPNNPPPAIVSPPEVTVSRGGSVPPVPNATSIASTSSAGAASPSGSADNHSSKDSGSGVTHFFSNLLGKGGSAKAGDDQPGAAGSSAAATPSPAPAAGSSALTDSPAAASPAAGTTLDEIPESKGKDAKTDSKQDSSPSPSPAPDSKNN